MRRVVPGPRAGVFLTFISLSGCVGYEPAPTDARQLLDELERVRLEPAPAAAIAPIGSTAVDPRDGLDVLEAAAIAVHLNPALRAQRAQVGVARAQLVQAGLLPDPVIGWDAMNVVADFATERKSSANSYTAGVSLAWDVPRPGEIDAREGVARARVREALAEILRAEWELVREVHLAYVRLAAAQATLAINSELVAITSQTVEFFQRARAAGAATAIQERLASVERDRVRSDRVRLEFEEVVARQTLLGLLGLPPGTPLLLQDPAISLDPPIPAVLDVAALMQEATTRRPDLRQLAAQYGQAEEQLRLEVNRQFPQLTIGTGIAIQLPFFSRFNHPAIETARREREAAADRFRTAVHEARRQLHVAHAGLQRAEAQVAFNQNELRPGLEQLLGLTRAALEMGEITPLEILAAQGQTISTQLEFLEARQRRAEAWVELQAASGRLLPRTASPEEPVDEPEEDEE